MPINQCIMNDQDRLTDLLTEEKYLITSYGSFIPEASCPQLRQVLTANFTDCVQNQFTLFDQMSQMGWYQTKDAPTADVDQARQKFTALQQQMSC